MYCWCSDIGRERTEVLGEKSVTVFKPIHNYFLRAFFFFGFSLIFTPMTIFGKEEDHLASLCRGEPRVISGNLAW